MRKTFPEVEPEDELVPQSDAPRRPIKVQKRTEPLDPRGWVSLAIPARNEEQCIAEVIERSIPFVDEIVVVDGHSVDRTVEIAESYGCRVVKDNKRGKGEAIRVGAQSVSHPIVVFMDADGSHDPADIPSIVEPILAGKADLVVGSRATGGSDELHGDIDKLFRMVGTDIILIGINKRWKQDLTESQNGFRAIRTDVIRSLNEDKPFDQFPARLGYIIFIEGLCFCDFEIFSLEGFFVPVPARYIDWKVIRFCIDHIEHTKVFIMTV